MRVSGGIRFALRRAGAARASLVALAVFAGLSGALVSAAASVDAARVAHSAEEGLASDGSAGVAAVAVGMLALPVALAAVLSAAEVTRSRAGETRLLLARGMRPRRLVTMAVFEAALIATVAGLAGALGAGVFLWMLTAAAAQVVLTATGVAVFVVGTAGAAGLLAGRESPPARGVAVAVAAIAVVAIVTGVATWRLLTFGVDPISFLAPALLLLVVATALTVLALAGLRMLSSAASRSRGLILVTALRRLSRRPGRSASSMIAVAIAVGISVVAASYTSSAVGVGEGPEALRVGADLRVVTIPADVTPSAISAAAGADAAMEGRQLVASMPSTRSERDRVPILALESQQIREVMTAIPGVVDPGEWSERLSRPSSAGQIPALVSQDVADDLGLIEGDSLALDASSPSLTADLVVAGVVPVIPGTPGSRGFLVDLARLAVVSGERVEPNQLWIAADDPGASAALIEREYPQVVVLAPDPAVAADRVAQGSILQVSAIGSVLIALTLLVLRGRVSGVEARDAALLSIVGAGRRGATTVVATQNTTALVVGFVAGIIGGAVTAAATVPPAVRWASGDLPAAYPVGIQVDVPALLVLLAVLLVGGLAIAWWVRLPRALARLIREDE